MHCSDKGIDLIKSHEGYVASTTIPNYRKPHSTYAVWNAVVEFILKRDGDLCGICGNELVSNIQIDHVIPRSVGGADTLDNFRLVHGRCNVSHFRKNFKTKPHPPRSPELRQKMSELMKHHWDEIRTGERAAPAYGPGVRSKAIQKQWERLSSEQRFERGRRGWKTRREKNAS